MPGDLARRWHDGAVYLGQFDDQVKICGLRIELGEIKLAIMVSGLIPECVVLGPRGSRRDRCLVAYLVPVDAWAEGLLTRHPAARLPAHIVPSAQVLLDALPVAANGKLDRKALPARGFPQPGMTRKPISNGCGCGLMSRFCPAAAVWRQGRLLRPRRRFPGGLPPDPADRGDDGP
jgi:hypothetical protein